MAALLRQARARTKEPLKRIVNEALRQGLLRMAAPRRGHERYRLQPVDLGRCLVGLQQHAAARACWSSG